MMILPDCLFCLGHIANLQPGVNEITIQGESFLLHRTGHKINYARSTLPLSLILIEKQNLLWVYRYGLSRPPLPQFDIFDTTWPVQSFEYVYPVPLRVVMENLYRLNYLGSPHRRGSLHSPVRVHNFQATGLTARYNVVADTTPNTFLSRLLRFFTSSDTNNLIHHVHLQFPGLLVFDTRTDKSKPAARNNSFTLLSIYPVDPYSTRVVTVSAFETTLLFQKILQVLSAKHHTHLFAEDTEILTSLTHQPHSHIRFPEDTPLAYTRTLYSEYS